MNKNTQTIASEEDEDLYNLFMLDIEPDLTTSMYPLLDDVYSWETVEQREGRMAWYEEAIEICKSRLSAFYAAWNEEIENVKTLMKEYMHGGEESQKAEGLQSIEDSIDAQ